MNGSDLFAVAELCGAAARARLAASAHLTRLEDQWAPAEQLEAAGAALNAAEDNHAAAVANLLKIPSATTAGVMAKAAAFAPYVLGDAALAAQIDEEFERFGVEDDVLMRGVARDVFRLARETPRAPERGDGNMAVDTETRVTRIRALAKGIKACSPGSSKYHDVEGGDNVRLLADMIGEEAEHILDEIDRQSVDEGVGEAVAAA